ncbi:MAG TPA: hypothetical protein VNN73_11475 [Blastocatellia bacterium]|nr:hypothetical protein [Blastocatellia bacterium]
MAIILILGLIMLAPLGCKKTPLTSSGEVRPEPSNANNSTRQTSVNVNQSASADDRDTRQLDSTAATLIGSFEISEVHQEGVVAMVGERTSRFTFRRDGNYTRISKKGNEIYHSDGGKYRVEGNDRLVLTIQVTKEKGVLKTPIEKTHKFTLSPDGQELRLITDDGKVAVYRRVG